MEYITLYCNLALAYGACLGGSCMHSEGFLLGRVLSVYTSVYAGLELKDDGYHSIALHYYLLSTRSLAC